MTRMDRTREALTDPFEVVWLMDEAEPELGKQPTIRTRDMAPALAEVVAWEQHRERSDQTIFELRDELLRIRLRLDAALGQANYYKQRAALGEGQDSDLAEPPEAATTPTQSGAIPEGNDGGTGGSARPCCSDPGDCGEDCQ